MSLSIGPNAEGKITRRLSLPRLTLRHARIGQGRPAGTMTLRRHREGGREVGRQAENHEDKEGGIAAGRYSEGERGK